MVVSILLAVEAACSLPPHEPQGTLVGRWEGVTEIPDGRTKAIIDFALDPDGSLKAAYRVAARPQTYFVDRSGVLRSIQIGELTDTDFERQYARIAATGP